MNAPDLRLADFQSFASLLRRRIELSRNEVALHDLDTGQSYIYADIGAQIRAYCALLASEGLVSGSSVATNLDNSPELAFLILAGLVQGVRIALIEPQTPAAQLKHYVDMVKPDGIFFSPDQLAERLLATSGAIDAAEWTGPSGDHDAFVIFSSGTTGKPKGIVHTHGNIAAELDSMVRAYQFKAGMQHCLMLPLAHASGLYRSLVMPLITGGTVHLRRQFDPAVFWADMVAQKIDFVQLVPSHIALLNRAVATPGQLSLEFVGTASSYLPPKEHLAFERRFGVPILQGYGMTECTCGIVLNSRDPAIRRVGAAGLPLDVNEVKIIDNAGIEVEQGEVGELHVRGPNVTSRFLGYDGPEFADGWLKTGDMARIDAAGNVVIVGRRANIINRGAYKIYALEVEEALAALPGMSEVAAIGVPHPVLGQDLVAFATVEGQPDLSSLLGELRRKLSSFKVPTEIIPIDRMPQNKLGKIQKNALLDIYQNRKLQSRTVDKDEIVPRLCRLIEDIFGLAPGAVVVESSRETIGPWDSLGHIQILAGIDRTFGVRLSDEAGLRAESVTDLVEVIAHDLQLVSGST